MQPGESHSTLCILHLDKLSSCICQCSEFLVYFTSRKEEMCNYVDEDVSVFLMILLVIRSLFIFSSL